MKTRTLCRLMPLLLLSLAGAPAPTATPAPASAGVTGAYIEARTASVFAGACHYNGERVTEGRSAIFACRIDSGSFDGVDLSGIRVAGAVASDDNLAERGAPRTTTLIVDATTDAKANAAKAWIEQRSAGTLGSITSVRRGSVTFQQDAEQFTVTASGLSMSVHAMPDHACCSQPELVWYQPLVPVSARKVGYTESARCDNAVAGATWQRSDENSAFYGKITP